MNTNEQTIHQMGLGISSLVKQATGRESVSNIEMDWVSVEQLARYIYGSGSGDVVSFNTNIPDAIDSLIAYITAVQDLHGYDNPWPAGGGKNILPLTITNIKALNTSGTWNENVYTENGLTFTCSVNSDGDITAIAVNGTASANTFLNIVSSALSSFLTDGNVYAINGCPESGSNSTYELQVRIGSGSYRDDYGNGTNLTFDASADSSSSKVRIVIYSGTEMTDKVYYPMIRMASDTDATFAPYSNICPITGWTGCTVTDANMLDSSDPDYEANTYAFTFPDEAGTVYGGTLDVLTGVLTVDKASIDMSSLSWSYISNNNYFRAALTQGKGQEPNNILCSMFKYAGVCGTNSVMATAENATIWKRFDSGLSSNATHLYVKWTDYTDAAQFKTAVTGQTVIYELAEPVTYQLTAQEVTALIGQNNIFADTGNVSVQYKVKEDLV